MKSLSKFAAVATGVIAVVAVSMSPVFASSPGQLAGGTGLYLAKDLTQGGSYASSINVAACDEVQYSMELSNVEFGALNNVTVSATLASNGGTSNLTATTDLGGATGTSGSTTVNVASGQTISYESGSTKLYDGNGNLIKTVSDGITTGGVNIGTINGSTTDYLNFKAKVSCPQTQNFSSSKTVTIPVNETANAQVNCSKGDTIAVADASASASATVTGSGSATSTVSQADADAKAQAAAQADANSKLAGVQASTSAQAQASANAAATAKCVPVTTTVTTSTPAALPNTGPGDDIGELFAGTSALGAAGHYLIRRFRR